MITYNLNPNLFKSSNWLSFPNLNSRKYLNKAVSYLPYFIASYVLLIVTSICLLLLVLVYIKHKLTHPFWANQPVCFRLKFLNNKSGVISHDLPKSKWLDLNHTIFIKNGGDAIRKDVCKYIINNGKDYMDDCLLKNIEYYLINHNYPVYLGVYKKSIQAKDIVSDEIPEYDNIAGVVTAIPLNFTMFKNKKQLNIHNKSVNLLNYLYYVDNLVVGPEYQNKRIACKLITGIHHTIKETQIPSVVGLFKRENDVNPFIKAFTSYVSYWFNIEYWFKTTYTLHPSVSCLEITQQNLNLLYSFLVSSHDKYFNCFIYPDTTSLATLIKNNVITIFCIMKGDVICAVYYFKLCDKDIILINSINANNSTEFFIHGFYYCMEKLYKQTKKANVRIEGLSHCKTILHHILAINSSIRYSNTSWYLYNYGIETKNSSELFILV